MASLKIIPALNKWEIETSNWAAQGLKQKILPYYGILRAVISGYCDVADDGIDHAEVTGRLYDVVLLYSLEVCS